VGKKGGGRGGGGGQIESQAHTKGRCRLGNLLTSHCHQYNSCLAIVRLQTPPLFDPCVQQGTSVRPRPSGRSGRPRCFFATLCLSPSKTSSLSCCKAASFSFNRAGAVLCSGEGACAKASRARAHTHTHTHTSCLLVSFGSDVEQHCSLVPAHYSLFLCHKNTYPCRNGARAICYFHVISSSFYNRVFFCARTIFTVAVTKGWSP